MSEKQKNNTNRLGTIPFVLLWTLSYGLGWGVLVAGGMFAINFLPQIFNFFPMFVFFIPLGAVPGLISGVIQQLLLRWKFGVTIRRWWLWSTLAAVGAAGGFYLMMEYLSAPINSLFNYLSQFNEMLAPLILIGSLFALYSTAQTWLLRHNVKRSWMWTVAAFVSAATFLLPVLSPGVGGQLWAIVLAGVAGLLQGSVMGLTLVWLFGMTRVEPLKRGLETAQLEAAKDNLADRHIIEDDKDYPQAQLMRQQR
jgi:hypothetical protein